jgi:hypothetical protein
MLLVPTKILLLIAAAVWLAAGLSVCSVGVTAVIGWSAETFVAFAVIYLFFLVIFLMISRKHSRRIRGYSDAMTSIFKFFDAKSYIIIAVMIGLGASARLSGLAPAFAIAAFCSGLGLALVTAAIYYIVTYVSCADEFIAE